MTAPAKVPVVIDLHSGHVTLGGRAVRLAMSSRARRQLVRERLPLEIELEVYFSCYLRKRVHFRREPHADVSDRIALSPHVTLSLRPVMTAACRVADVEGEPDLVALPIDRRRAIVPRWITLDFKRGQWSGDFGFDR